MVFNDIWNSSERQNLDGESNSKGSPDCRPVAATLVTHLMPVMWGVENNYASASTRFGSRSTTKADLAWASRDSAVMVSPRALLFALHHTPEFL